MLAQEQLWPSENIIMDILQNVHNWGYHSSNRTDI